MVEGFKYEHIIQSNPSNGISFNWIGWVIDDIFVIKKAKNSILSPYALRSFVAGVGLRPLNQRKRERKRYCPRTRENENGFQVFSYLAALLTRSLCRQLDSLPDIFISAFSSPCSFYYFIEPCTTAVVKKLSRQVFVRQLGSWPVYAWCQYIWEYI